MSDKPRSQKRRMPVVFSTRISADDMERIDRAAKQQGVSRAAYIRSTLLEQKSEVTQCPSCRISTIRFDPPIRLEPEPICGAVKPGTYSGLSMPSCIEAKGHDGPHWDVVEIEHRWSELPANGSLTITTPQ